MLIAYFAHELADAAVQKRLRMLRIGDRRIVLLGFQRGAPAPPIQDADVISLGRTVSGQFVQRALAVLLAFPRAWRARAHWANADVILARNLEMLTIACLMAPIVGARGRIVYECLDIHRLMLRTDLIGKMMRGLERRWLRRIASLLTSSPAFVANYFQPVQRYDGPVLLVENKVLALDAPRPTKRDWPDGPPWTIAWCGVLRCAKSFDLLTNLAAQSEGRVLVELWGQPALDQIPDFHARVAATPNITFHGRYSAADFARLYGGAHFIWAIDYFESGGNSDWLLPNRLYEGLYQGAVPLAVAGLETAHWLQAHNVGVALAEPLAQTLPAFLQGESSESYRTRSASVAALDAGLLAFDRADCLALLGEP